MLLTFWPKTHWHPVMCVLVECLDAKSGSCSWPNSATRKNCSLSQRLQFFNVESISCFVILISVHIHKTSTCFQLLPLRKSVPCSESIQPWQHLILWFFFYHCQYLSIEICILCVWIWVELIRKKFLIFGPGEKNSQCWGFNYLLLSWGQYKRK